MKKNNNLLLIGIIAIALIGFGYWWYNSNNNNNNKVVKIGAILALTGKASVVGQGEQKGIQLAMDSLKIKYPNIEFKVFFEDYASDTKKSVAAINKLITVDNIDILISSSTGVAEALSPIVESKKIPHFVISPDIEIVNKSKYNFRIYYSLKTESIAVNRFIKDNKFKTISFLSVQAPSFQRLIEDEIKPFLIKENIKVSNTEYFDVSQNDFKNQITKIVSSKPELIFVSPMPNQIETITNQLRELNKLQSNIIGSFSYNWKPINYINSLEKYYLVTPNFQLSDSLNIYKKAFVKKFNSTPNFDMMYSYDIMNIIGYLVNKDGIVYEKMAINFDEIGLYNGASGQIEFVGNRDTKVGAKIVKINNNKIQVLENGK